jgi:thiol-disulfide isomerase/thioredoxin
MKTRRNLNIYTCMLILLASVAITKGQVKFVIPQFTSTQASDSIILYTAHDYLTRGIEEPSNKKVWKLSKGNKFSLDLGQEYSFLVIHNERFTNRNRPLLVKNGLEIYLSIDSAGRISFAKGQSKLVECQLKFAQLSKYPRSKNIKVTKKDVDNLLDARNYNRSRMDSILSTYVLYLSEAEREMLRINCSAGIDLALFSFLGHINSDNDIIAYAYNMFQQIVQDSMGTHYEEKSFFPALIGYYSFVREVNDLKFKRSLYGQKFIFKDLYNQIKAKTIGVVRDRAVTECILKEIQYDQFPIDYLDSALVYMKDSVSRMMILAQKESRAIGRRIYPFAFEDVQGRSIRQIDLMGKVLVIDFWFNGCLGCAKLGEAMEDVIEKFHAGNVIFLSVNVDKKRNNWIKGINTGIYTSPYSLNVYTNGLGKNHPFLLNYKYRSFPQLMIVDRHGKLVTTNATRPFGDERREELITTIENLLK